ncbi:MAG: hypothetical protein U9N49_13405 [Campylobacterota bacterium]|nr:hypothetical protein [Campylobacterota bacterium]
MKLATKLSMAALIALLSLNSCGSDRAGDINSTNPDTNDQKADDPLADSDGDGLLNGEEDANWNGVVDDGETDPNNKDTDGDGLWDGNEIRSYGTDPLNPDTDDDGIDDGREVYSCDELEFDTQKVTQHFAANVHHGDSPDVIDALDQYNDSDGDGRSNIGEKIKGTDGCDPLDTYPYVTESCEGIKLAGAVYIPGGFDVDKDGEDETGFWFSAYPASATNRELDSAHYENFNETAQEKYNLLNGDRMTYTTDAVYHSNIIYEPKFTNEGTQTDNYMSKLYGMDIPIAIAEANIPSCAIDSENSYDAVIPSNKQYIHIMEMLRVSEDGETIKNGVLGLDPNVPADYETKVHYIGEFREYTRDIVVLEGFEAPAYWDIRNESDITTSGDDTGDTIYGWADVDVGFGAPGWMDPLAIVVREGWTIDLTFGIGSGDGTRGSGVLFRMATPYLEVNEAQDVSN